MNSQAMIHTACKEIAQDNYIKAEDCDFFMEDIEEADTWLMEIAEKDRHLDIHFIEDDNTWYPCLNL